MRSRSCGHVWLIQTFIPAADPCLHKICAALPKHRITVNQPRRLDNCA
ncbi:hypothetical protein BIWAKO_00541 [Bosea sp. BIWAKO-01]|nr:hypothetical protein BIWAKO_00541 [Bosea sp. BIWAKO-01]